MADLPPEVEGLLAGKWIAPIRFEPDEFELFVRVFHHRVWPLEKAAAAAFGDEKKPEDYQRCWDHLVRNLRAAASGDLLG